MLLRRIIFFLTIFSSFYVSAQTYITHVTVIDVVNQKLIPDRTVVKAGGIITGVYPASSYKISEGGNVINGKGKFLMPGLVDAHVHFFQSGGLYTRPDAIDLRKYRAYEDEIEWSKNNFEDLLRRYVQNGITTVVDPGATNNLLTWRAKYKDEGFAPRVVMAGPLITTYEPDEFKNLGDNEPFNYVTSIEQARAAVQNQLDHHPDIIKIWYIANITGKDIEDSARRFQPIIKATIDEAHKHKLKVAVHATERITAQLAVESGCDYLVHDVEDEIVSAGFIKLLLAKKVTLCPTLIVIDGYNKTFAQKNNFNTYDLRRSNPEAIGSLEDLKHIPDSVLVARYKMIELNAAYFNHVDSIRKVNLKKMSDAGVNIITGTDAGNIGTMHATSYFTEIKAMKQSGMSNWQILQASTFNAAKMLGKEHEFGSLGEGLNADMILLDANPLIDIQNLKKINLVFNKGYIYRPDTLIKETPLALVQRQVNGYNLRNIDAFLEPYADDVELYQYPDKLISKGKAAMRKDYTGMFAQLPHLHCEIKERKVEGNVITDSERVTGLGNNTVEATAIYHIEGNKINKVYFKR